MRVATIDIGTNTVLLLVAEIDPRSVSVTRLVAVEEHATITRLGEGVDRTRVLAPAAVERTRTCLDEYAAIVKRLGATRVDVVGTSAMRDAGGGEAIRDHVLARFGVPARVVSGDEEARLTFAGALVGLEGEAATSDVLVFDIGGGSTEVVRGTRGEGGRATLTYARSFDVGSVRMTERHVRSDPPSPAERDAIVKDVASSLAALPPLGEAAREPVGIAGTVTTLAAVELGLATYDGARVHGHRMSVEAVREVVERLASVPLEARRALPGVHPKRADVIVAGGLVVLTLLEQMGAKSLRISDRGVRWGLALDLALARPGSSATV